MTNAELQALCLQQNSIAKSEGRIDKNGHAQRTVEKKDFMNDLIGWHESGKPEEGLAPLQEREKFLRENNLY